MADKKRGLTDEEWVGCRARYEAGESVSSLSRAFKVSRSTIIAHIKKDGWKRSPANPTIDQPIGTARGGVAESIKSAVQSNVISIATRQAIDQMTESGVVDDMAEQIGELELLYLQMERESLLLAIDTMQRARADGALKDPKTGEVLKPLRSGAYTSEAGERKDAVSAADTAAKLSRELRGKRSGTPSIAAGDDDGKPTIIELEIVDGPGELTA